MQPKPELNNNTEIELKDIITLQIHPNILSNLYYIKDLLELESINESLAHCVGYVLENQINPILKEYSEQKEKNNPELINNENLSIPEPPETDNHINKFKYMCENCNDVFLEKAKVCKCGVNFKKKPDLLIDLYNTDNKEKRPVKKQKRGSIGGLMWD
jgi:hypothetical protein